MYQVKEKLLKLQEEIAPYTPNIIAVTKYFGADGIIEAYNSDVQLGEGVYLVINKKVNDSSKDTDDKVEIVEVND